MMLKRGLIASILLILLASLVSAIGITPAKQHIVPRLDQQDFLFFTLLNLDQGEDSVTLRLEGELAQYFNIETQDFTFTQGESSKEVRLSYLFNEAVEPGLYTLQLVASQAPKDTQAQLSFSSSVAARITVLIAYPGKLASAKFYVFPKEGYVDFSIPISNLGEEHITNANAKIDIYHKDELIESVNTQTIMVPAKGAGKLTAQWANADIGLYRAIANIEYDGEQITLEKSFSVGKDFIALQPIGITPYGDEEITKLIFTTSNLANLQLNDIYAQVEVIDSEGKVIDEISTKKISLSPKEEQQLSTYLNTRYYPDGIYDLDVKLYYENKPDPAMQTSYENKLRVDSSVYTITRPKTNALLITTMIILWIFSLLLLVLLLSRSKRLEKCELYVKRITKGKLR